MRSTQPRRIRVVVKASDPITYSGIAGHLEACDEVCLLDPQHRMDADVVILVPDRLNAETLAAIRQDTQRGHQPAILIANKVEESDLIEAVRCRIMAVLPRVAATDERLLASIRAVVTKKKSLPAELLTELLTHIERLQRDVLAARGLDIAGLHTREVDVLRLMSEGLDTAEIADKLCYSQRTVKNIIYAVNSRLNLRNRPHAVAYAMRAGVI